MTDSRDRSTGGSALLISTMAGAVFGAAGLAWWLLSEADRRRQAQRHLRVLRQAGLHSIQNLQGHEQAPVEEQLHDRVQQLNQAIDAVRRQLEELQSPS